MFSVLEKVLELTDMKVFYLLVNSQLGHQFFFRARSSKTGFEHNFARVDLLSLLICKDINISESALS